MVTAMGKALTIHVVDGDARRRVEAARLFLALGHHAEVYADLGELLRHPPNEGVIIAHDGAAPRRAVGLLATLDRAGISLPLIVASESADVCHVVDAISAGAFDYVQLPLDKHGIAVALRKAASCGAEHEKTRKRMIAARAAIRSLSSREREVFDLLVAGGSNKLIARTLAISPRTVEIHRANMMHKIGANHVAGAVRLFFEARFPEETP